MSEVLLTQEVGSLAKPNWRVQPLNGQLITDSHIREAAVWGERLGFTPEEATGWLEAGKEQEELDIETQAGIRLLAARFAIRLQEAVGLDILYDGEQYRPEMYQDIIDKATGFEPRGRVRAFDNKSYLKSSVTEPPGIPWPGYVEEFGRVRALTDRQVKVPITGAYTIADWSFDEYYQKSLEKGGRGLPKEEARRAFILDVAERVVRPHVASLVEAGADWVQIDEPAATTKPYEVPLFVESFNRSVAGLAGKFSVHICFSDYSLLFPHVAELENCSQFSLEFANRDSADLGTDKAARPAYGILEDFAKHTPDAGIGLGVTNIHVNQVETPELVRDRVLRAVDVIGDPAKVYPSPDCGLRTRSWGVAFDKLRATVEGTALARQQL